MPTARKKETVKEMSHLFNHSQVLIFTDYRGLRVSDLNNLRRQLRDKGVEYHISKNTLTTLAAKRAGVDQMGNLLDGPTAIAFVTDDIPGAAKVLQDFVRTSRILTIRGGLAGKQVLNADQVGDLTKILPREQYISKIMGSLNMPVTSLVSVLANTVRGFLNVLNALIDKQGGAPETAETASNEGATESAGDTAPEETTAADEATTTEAAATTEDTGATEDGASTDAGADADAGTGADSEADAVT
ncbi:MAG: large subunit ribosomal protein [Chloroflexia bacterium]|jgi:large subunit ribosomal protein L10|nr:large subunit ribosomal protein [Chloroflexia bacterium]